jgi:hypothetical protein
MPLLPFWDSARVVCMCNILTHTRLAYDPGETQEEHDAPDVEQTPHQHAFDPAELDVGPQRLWRLHVLLQGLAWLEAHHACEQCQSIDRLYEPRPSGNGEGAEGMRKGFNRGAVGRVCLSPYNTAFVVFTLRRFCTARQAIQNFRQ